MAGLTSYNRYSQTSNTTRSAGGSRVRSTGRSVVSTGNRSVVGNSAVNRITVNSPGQGPAGLSPEAIRAMVERAKGQVGLGVQQAQAAAQNAIGQAKLAVPQGRDQVRALVQQIAAERGWTGPQWEALHRLVMKESGYNPTAQNPTSTAYGIFQFLNKTWGNYGAQKTSDPAAQTRAGLNYIAQRYGDPSRALNFHLRNNWY